VFDDAKSNIREFFFKQKTKRFLKNKISVFVYGRVDHSKIGDALLEKKILKNLGENKISGFLKNIFRYTLLALF
jgi:hypothetical protein